MIYLPEQKEQARIRFLRGETIPEIAAGTGVGKRTLYNWSREADWNAAACRDDVLLSIKKRIALLLDRENKTEREINELDRLLIHVVKLEELKVRSSPAAAGNADGKGSGGGSQRGRKKQKNDLTGIDPDELVRKFMDNKFDYQKQMWDHRRDRIRNVLKSRQIGFTYYFAGEGFTDAVIEGRNKIFLSASRAQADVFREYIKAAAWEYCNVELSGKDKIELITRKGVCTLYFLSTNSATAQSYHGDVYIDEYFWIPRFDVLNKVASAMASQKQWSRTYFSTPSVQSHPAYPFWSGELFNERQKRRNLPLVEFPGRDALRSGGRDCPDGQFRIIITLDDAEKAGCTLFDKNQLHLEYSEDEFDQLFECKFPANGAGCFSFADLSRCLSDAAEWKFLHPDRQPAFDGPVWIGYDPSRTRDGACIVAVAPPAQFNGKFYVLEKNTLHNASWEYQANCIKDLCKKYHVEHIAIDTTGPGSGVYEMVCTFFPAAEALHYSLELKSKLVLKGQQIVKAGRIAWDASYSDIAAGFLLIRKVATQNGAITYVAERTDKTGHADSAWAILHVLIHEDLVTVEDDGECVID